MKVGDMVRVLSYECNRVIRSRPMVVTGIRDHVPVDGTRDSQAIAELSDGTQEFVWNLEACN